MHAGRWQRRCAVAKAAMPYSIVRICCGYLALILVLQPVP